jgi:hypothetical protein
MFQWGVTALAACTRRQSLVKATETVSALKITFIVAMLVTMGGYGGSGSREWSAFVSRMLNLGLASSFITTTTVRHRLLPAPPPRLSFTRVFSYHHRPYHLYYQCPGFSPSSTTDPLPELCEPRPGAGSGKPLGKIGE